MKRSMIAILAVLALVLAACGGDDDGDGDVGAETTTTTEAEETTTTGAEEETTTTTEGESMAMPEGTVTLAAMGPFTGAAASIGQEQLNFARLAVEDFNAETGWDVQLFEADTELDAARGVTAAEGIVADDSVYGVVGPAGSQVVSAVGGLLSDADLPFVSPSATDPGLTEFSGFFRVVPTDEDQGPTIGNYITNQLGASSVFIIDDQTSYSVGLADQIDSAVAAAGGEVAGRESVTQDLSDFSSLATVIGGSGAEVVAFPGQIASQGASLARAMQDQGIEVTLFGGDGFFSPEDFIAAAGGATEGAYVSSFAPDVSELDAAADVVAVYEERFGDFGTFGPPTYVAARVVLEAMLRAFEANGELTRAAVLEEVAATNFDTTILGRGLSFEEGGNVVGAEFFIFTVENGEFVLVD